MLMSVACVLRRPRVRWFVAYRIDTVGTFANLRSGACTIATDIFGFQSSDSSTHAGDVKPPCMRMFARATRATTDERRAEPRPPVALRSR